MKIMIGADIVPTERNRQEFAEGNINALLGSALQEKLKEADYRIFNLEAPIWDGNAPIQKFGPCLKAPAAAIHGITGIAPSFLTLANNHILDHGEGGLTSTVALLNEHHIDYAGVGVNMHDMKKYHIAEIAGQKVGIYCCAEHEFSIASDTTAGANPYDPLESFDDVAKLAEKCDYVVVLYHGGKEYYRYPSPGLRRVFRKFADKGANLVIAQHTHCIGCREQYGKSTLVYGQGNFLFSKKDDEFWNTALLIEIELNGESNRVSYIPLIRTAKGTEIADEPQGKTILDAFYQRSDAIAEEGFVEKKYAEFVQEKFGMYLMVLRGQQLGERVFRKIFGDEAFCRKLKPAKALALRNFLECEAHNEIILNQLKSTKTEIGH